MKRSKLVTIATLGSHSALDICRGAKDEGFATLVVAQAGREQTYAKYYKSTVDQGCIDDCLIVDKFVDVLTENIQKKLRTKNTIFIPHRSFEAYLNFDYEAIENDFHIPVFGNRYLLKIEERGKHPNQYNLLEAADIRYPRQFLDPKEIDRLCLVKALEGKRGFERAFFLVKNYKDYREQVNRKLKKKVFTKNQLAQAVIEEFVVGTQVNFNFFYSPIHQRLELIGTDTRRQTNAGGIAKIPSRYQSDVIRHVSLKYEESGHIAVTVLESLLEDAFALGERFVVAAKNLFSPGIIGPFSLQTIIIPGPPKKDIIVIDVSPRMPGSPGIGATPYSAYRYGYPVSMGRRIAMEIREAIRQHVLEAITT